MIGLLGQSPISSVTKVGTSEFLSLLKPRASKAFSNETSGKLRPYVKTRGILINKDYLKGSVIDLSKGYRFQFNPSTINDVKEVIYEARTYTGLPYQDYIWGGGGQRTISFQLFLDDTPQTHAANFNPTSIGGKESATIVDKDGNSIAVVRADDSFGQGVIGEVTSQFRTAKDSVKAMASNFSKGLAMKPSSFNWDMKGSDRISRTNKRGILDDVELIQSFLYPAPFGGERTPKFSEGGVTSMSQFRPPATAVLCIGPLYLEGVVRSAPVQYTLFDEDLCPIRATIDLGFTVFDFEEITRKIGNYD